MKIIRYFSAEARRERAHARHVKWLEWQIKNCHSILCMDDVEISWIALCNKHDPDNQMCQRKRS